MRRWKIEPRAKSAKDYVDCYWFIHRDSSLNSYPKLSPDATTHLVITHPDQTYTYSGLNNEFSGQGTHCIYPHNETYTMDHSLTSKLLGIKLKPGSTYSLDVFNSKHRTNYVSNFNLMNLDHEMEFDINEILNEATLNPERVRDKLDSTLESVVSNSIEDIHSRLVRDAIEVLKKKPINQIGQQLNKSQRTVERSFLKVTGFTMKQCQSIFRLEDMLQELYDSQQDQQNWGNIAAKYGFNDQSHLIRYMKTLTGVTPGEYDKNRDMTIDIYGNFVSY